MCQQCDNGMAKKNLALDFAIERFARCVGIPLGSIGTEFPMSDSVAVDVAACATVVAICDVIGYGEQNATSFCCPVVLEGRVVGPEMQMEQHDDCSLFR